MAHILNGQQRRGGWLRWTPGSPVTRSNCTVFLLDNFAVISLDVTWTCANTGTDMSLPLPPDVEPRQPVTGTAVVQDVTDDGVERVSHAHVHVSSEGGVQCVTHGMFVEGRTYELQGQIALWN